MRVGVYDRWLSTLGGGERHALTIAAHLARTHEVAMISHTPASAGEIGDRLHLDLARVDFRPVPLRPPEELGPVAAQYDLFINASNLDFVPPLAAHNAMLVYFPAAPPIDLMPRLRRRAGQWIEDFARLPRPVEDVYGLQEFRGVRAHGLGAHAQYALPACPRPYTVRLSLAAAHAAVDGAELQRDGKRVSRVALPAGSFARVEVNVPAGTHEHTLTIQARDARGRATEADAPILLYMTPPQLDTPRFRAYHLLFERAWPGLGVRMQNVLPVNLRAIAAGYDQLWANSQYTQRWIDAYWRLPSTVLYPPVDVAQFAPHHKRRMILSVGRFFAGNHNKKHLLLIRQFRKLVDGGLAGWELHLAGGSTPGAMHQAYLHRVQSAARGYPIHVHVDLPFARLAELYGAASIYWHAGGYGEDEAKQPAKFEHFGITAVEAMAAGCAPVLIGRGGLTELVRHGEDGFLWYTTDELRGYTLRLIADARLRSRIAQAAMLRSRTFDVVAFTAALDRALALLLNG